MFTCAECRILACDKNDQSKKPANCPMHDVEFYRKVKNKYQEDGVLGFFQESARVEKEGYGQWPRTKEIMQFCRKMNYREIGVAFCGGLKKEAAIFVKILKDNEFSVTSVVCKNGGIPKEEFGLEISDKINPDSFEAMCNPIGQALLLNREKTDFNVVIGLCVGHDSLFFKYSQAPTTVLIAKDRVLAHNPAGALYCYESYYKKHLLPGT